MRFTSIGIIKRSYVFNSGYTFEIQLQDETQKLLKHHIVLHHQNELVTAIGQKRFAELVLATGKVKLTDTDELNGFQVIVQYNSENDIRSVKPTLVKEFYELPRKSLLQRFKDWI